MAVAKGLQCCVQRYFARQARIRPYYACSHHARPWLQQMPKTLNARIPNKSICQSQPLIAARGPDRDTRHTVATSHWEYQEEQLWSRQKTTTAHGEIRLPTERTERRLASIDTAYNALTDKHQICSSGLTSTSIWDMAKSNWEYKEQNRDHSNKKTIAFGDARLGAETQKFVCWGLVILVLWLAFPSLSSPSTEHKSIYRTTEGINTRTVSQGVSMEKLADEFIVQVQSALYGQHIATEVIKSSFRHASVNKYTKVVTLLMIGPVGSGKSFTSRMLQYVLKAKGFAISRAGNDLRHLDITNNCRHWRYYQNLAIVIDGAGDDFQDELKSGDFIIGLKHCSNFNKILIIIESCAFAKEIKQYIFSQCKFNDDRLTIQPKDVIDYISMTKGISLNFETGDSRHVILPMIFLPLDVNHVKMCIKQALLLRGIDKEKWNLITDDVMTLFEFYPQCGMRYPEVGCKLVNSRVDYVINRDDVQKYYIRNKKT